MIKIFIDESGTHDDANVVTVAAYAGRPKAWREWSAEWRKAKKPIKVFHAVDAANREGEFKGWSQEKRTELVTRLLPVIMRNRIAGLVIALNKSEFRKAIEGKEELLKALGNPYTTCFHWLVQSTLELLKPGKKETLKFVHEKNSYEKEAKASFEFIANDANPNNAPMRLLFGGKNEHMPLQTADILAYEAYKRFQEPNKPERKPWQILKPKIVSVHVGKDQMSELVQSLEEIMKNIGGSGSQTGR